MIFPKDFEVKCGFSSLRLMLKEKCLSRLGKDEADAMNFSEDEEIIKKRLKCVDEFLDLMANGDSLPDEGVKDVTPLLNQLKAEGAYLSADNFSKLSSTLQAISAVHRFFSNSQAEEVKYPELTEEFNDLENFLELEKKINSAIGKFGEVYDTASPLLNEIRREIRVAGGSMQKAMKKFLETSVKSGVIDSDVNPSMRDGRLVVPVSAGMKKEIKGIIHDQSASGKTIFIEPFEVVEAGNRIRRLELEEQNEIVKILKELSDIVRPFAQNIISSCMLMGKLDFIRAKAIMALEYGGEMPILEKYPDLDWYHAIHPGLFFTLKNIGKKAVPLNIKLTSENRILIISGPNAGGKSVCLKTVAIVQYMMQCGMLPSLHYNSHMGIFKGIFMDIGDEQSIENDLSTYSSHLMAMKFFLNHAKKGNLVLADEMGSGTEPHIGEAIAESILEKLGESGCFGVVTTHFQQLKSFADSHKGFVNGAMLYDRQLLQPTFQLSIGNPGSSFALEIARKIGLPSDVIENAKAIAGNEYVNSEKYLLDIQRDRKYWINKRNEIKEKSQKLDRLLENYEEKSELLRSQRNHIIKEAKEEAKDILSKANAHIERSIHEIRKAAAEKEKTRSVRHELKEYANSIETLENSEAIPEVLKPLKHKSNKSKKAKKETEKFELDQKTVMSVGDCVKMSQTGNVGKILSISGKKAEVAFGNLRTFVDLSKLLKTNPPVRNNPEVKISYQTIDNSGSRERQLNFKNEIDIRGMNVEQASQAVAYFIDDALQFNISRVRILHGTGFGVLRAVIRDYLKGNPNIESFHDEDVRFGGAGITVVNLN